MDSLDVTASYRPVNNANNDVSYNDFLPTYQEALIKAGYDHKLKYQKQDQKKDNSQHCLHRLEKNNNIF